MKLPLLCSLVILLLGTTAVQAQRVLQPLNVTITGTAAIEAPALPFGTKVVPILITPKLLATQVGVSTVPPTYALVFDQMSQKLVLRGISAAAALPDKVLLDFSSSATQDVEVGTTSTRTRLTLTQNVKAGANAGNTIFKGLAGIALISTYTPPGFPYPHGPDHKIYTILAQGTNTTASNADNPGAVLQFKLTTGLAFVQKP